MTRRVRTGSSLLALLTLVVITAAPAGASHSWGSYHWARTSNPFTLRLNDSVSTKWDPYLATTSSDWSASSVLDTTVVGSGGNPRSCKAKSGQVQVCSASYGSNGWLGLAQVWVSGSHITAGAVKVNDTYFNTATYNTPAWRNLVMCQEVGHTLGLDHQDENFGNANLGTCMDYTSNPSTNQHPNQHDYDQLATIYAHLDSTTTISSGVSGAKAPRGVESPGDWGRLVSGSRDPHAAAIYERDLGAGQKVFTFVVWAR